MNQKSYDTNYDSDLTDEKWALLEPVLPLAWGPGRPVETDLRAVINAIFYRIRTGCQWRYLPGDFPPAETVYYYFRKWAKDQELGPDQRSLTKARTGCTRALA